MKLQKAGREKADSRESSQKAQAGNQADGRWDLLTGQRTRLLSSDASFERLLGSLDFREGADRDRRVSSERILLENSVDRFEIHLLVGR